MSSEVPVGHPGDLAWRLPVWRTLLRLQLVNPAQLEPANALARDGGFFLSHLVTLGVNPDKLLTAIAIATGLPSAPRHEVRRPPAGVAAGLDGALLKSLGAAPFLKEPDLLHLAFVVPLPKERLEVLPRHKAYVALEGDIRDGLAVLFPKVRPSQEPPLTPEAPPLDSAPLPLPLPPGRPPANSGTPSAEQLQHAGLVETFITPREELLGNLLRFKWPAAGLLGLLLLVKLGSMVIDASRSEVEKKGGELREGMGLAAVEAARDQQRVLRPGAEPPRAGSFDQLSSAMAELDASARGKDLGAFHQQCVRVASELKAYAPPAPQVRQMGPLSNLGSEALMLCEREHLQPPLEEWQRLRSKIMGVLKGD